MDKRTVLFVLLVGAAFFGLNLFFSHKRSEQNREYLAQQEAQTTKHNEMLRSDVAKRTAPLSSLPVVPASTEIGGAPIAYGIDTQGEWLTVAWSTSLPGKVFVGKQELFLQTQDVIVGGPVLYTPKDFGTLDIAALPTTGTYDVQALTFYAANPPQVQFAEYSDGSLQFPFGAPEQNALVLYKTDTGYMTLGFYEWRGDVFVELQDLPLLTRFVTKAKHPLVTHEVKEEKFYRLENDYTQIVFSNVGGAVAEINLPFVSPSNTHSVVKEIEFDRMIDRQSPENARFPLHATLSPGQSEPSAPGQIGGYYPLIRRGTVSQPLKPQYYAFNIVSDYPEMAELIYQVKEFTDTTIVFEATQAHRKITKTYTLADKDAGAPYCLNLSIKIEGDSRGLWLTSGLPEVEIMSNSSSPQIQYRITRKGKSEVDKLDLPKPKEVITLSSVTPDWVVNSNGYLGVILDPLSEIASGYKATAVNGSDVPTRLSLIDPRYTPFPASKYPGYEVLLPLPSKGGKVDFRFYTGPFEENTLKMVDKLYSDPATGYSPDYIACRTFYGWFSFISEPFAKLLFLVMKFFYFLTSSWGFSIILLTVFLRILLYPLNAWSIKSMRRMQEISPQVQAIQQKYKKDPKKAQIEIMSLYREKKVNPFMGCIPILIQIPFLIGMFDLLKSSFQLRGASFIPGWIDNLTAPDVLFQWQRPIFFIGNQFHLLPILLGVVMFIQQRISSPLPKDPKMMTDQQRQQKAMGTIMTVVFTVMFYHFPSGLNIYWLSSMLLGILQQWMMNKSLDKQKKKPEVIIEHKKAKKHL